MFQLPPATLKQGSHVIFGRNGIFLAFFFPGVFCLRPQPFSVSGWWIVVDQCSSHGNILEALKLFIVQPTGDRL